MAILIVKAAENLEDDELLSGIQKQIINGIHSSGKDFFCVNIGDLQLKNCRQKECPDRVFDKTSRFGCLKNRECIDEHNYAATEIAYKQMVEAEAIVYFWTNKRVPIHLFFEEINKKEKEFCKKRTSETGEEDILWRGQLADKKYIVIASAGRFQYPSGLDRLIMQTIEDNKRYFHMKDIDTFIIEDDNEEYMKNVVPFAVELFAKAHESFHKDTAKWVKHHYGI